MTRVVYPRNTYNYYQDNVWDSGMEFVDNCGKCKNNDYTVGLRPLVKMKIDALMEEYSNIEWLAYLTGFIDNERGYAEMTDLIIPRSQSITAASVDDVERDFPACGVIHSHHNMNMSFSNTDWSYINSNNDISIVVYDGGRKMDCSMRVRAQCGAMTFITPKIQIVFNDEFDKDGFIRDARSKIHRTGIGEFGYGYGYGYGYNYGSGYNFGRGYGYQTRQRNSGRGSSVIDELEEEISRGNAPEVHSQLEDEENVWDDIQKNDVSNEELGDFEMFDDDGNKIRLEEDGSIVKVKEDGSVEKLSEGNQSNQYSH